MPNVIWWSTVAELPIPRPMSSASMVLHVLAEFVAPHGATIYRSELLQLMTLLDMNVGTAGSAATRLAELGWLMRRRAGRFTHYTITPAARYAIAAQQTLPAPPTIEPAEATLADLTQELDWFLRRYRAELTALQSQLQGASGSPLSPASCFVRLFWLGYEYRLLLCQDVQRWLAGRWQSENVAGLRHAYQTLLDERLGDFVARRVFTVAAVI